MPCQQLRTLISFLPSFDDLLQLVFVDTLKAECAGTCMHCGSAKARTAEALYCGGIRSLDGYTGPRLGRACCACRGDSGCLKQARPRKWRGGHCGALPGGASCSISVLMVRMALELKTGRAARLSSAKAYQPTNADGAHTSCRARCGRWVQCPQDKIDRRNICFYFFGFLLSYYSYY